MATANSPTVPTRFSLRKKLLFVGVSVFFGGALGLFALELILRVWIGPISNEITNVHPVLHHFTGNNPNTNRFGFYDKDYPEIKPDGTIRVMVIGDSLVRRGAAGENFTDLLENQFREQSSDQTVEVWNCGVDSYSPALEYLLLRHKLIDLKPDFVVACFFMGNDFNDDAVYEAKMEFDDMGKPLRCSPDKKVSETQMVSGQLRIPFKNYLRTHSRLYRELSKAYNTVLHWTGIRQGEWGKAKIDVGRSAPIGTLTINVSDALIQLVSRNFLFMKELLDEHNIPWLVVLIPLDAQVNREVDGKLESSAFRDEDVDVANKNEEELKAALEENGISVLDLLPILLEYKDQPVYILGSHFSENGHRAVAETLFERLSSRWSDSETHT
ncbi:MAG: hypothetical protein ABIH23_13945 [bacterium]